MAYRFAFANRVTNNLPKSPSQALRRLSSYFQPSESEYVDVAVYPPIIDRQSKADRKIEAEAKKITGLPTVEEKLIELNAPKYYGWWACQLSDHKIPYGGLPFYQFATRTAVQEGLPAIYSTTDEAVSQYLPIVKSHLSELILQEFEYAIPRTNSRGQTRTPATEEDRFARNFIPLLNRLLTSILAPGQKHLTEAEVDVDSRIEAFWSLGGIEPDKLKKKALENNPKLFHKKADDLIDRPMQFTGKASLTIRHHHPLPQLIDRDSGLSVDGYIPEWRLDPRVLGLKYEHSPAVNIPGFWPGTQQQHGFLSILRRGFLLQRESYLGGSHDRQEALHSQAILHSFAWTLAQACYLGFGPYTELTYPLSSQTIITNGQTFSFYAYQLNTCALYNKNSSDVNPHRNVCFATNEAKMFDVVENGQIKGFNDDVLKTLIKFYLMKPVEPTIQQRPYLGPECYIANVTNTDRRLKVENTFKHLFSKRPRHLLKPEIYHWEKIYKIDHDTRPMEPKRRWFERKDPDPGCRRLDDHAPPYIPRNLRNPPKKSRRGRLPVTPTIKL